MSLVDVKKINLFPVEILRIVTDLDHQAITEYTLKHREKWDRYTTYHDQELNKEWQAGLPDKEKFELAIKKASDEFCIKTKRRPFKEDYFIYYWVSVYDEHDQHGSHNHPNSLIAGTYYPNVGSDSSSIQLECPYDQNFMHDSQDGSERLFNYKPNIGDMLMWPSWLYHRVPLQKKSDTRRIAISFNVDYEKYHD